jgi:gliding motility-associated lipoprotein GldD
MLPLLITGCGETLETPKPRAYPRIVYPEKHYRLFETGYCPLTFDAPDYAVVERDTTFFGEKPESDCWFNLFVPMLNARLYCSYNRISKSTSLDELVKDAFDMTNKHQIKASYIDEIPVHRKAERVHGILFQVEGPAASSYQFFVTDSTRHFLRGALYFNTQARPDSLAPVVAFMRADLDRMINTLTWL